MNNIVIKSFGTREKATHDHRCQIADNRLKVHLDDHIDVR